MGSVVEYRIECDPVPKGRPRAAVRGRHATLYTPKKTADYEAAVSRIAKEAMSGDPLEGPVKVTIIAYFTFPKSRSKRDRAEMRNGLVPCLNRADVDNLAKSILDAMNGIVYLDDRQVTRLLVEKYYADEGKCLVRVESNSPENKD